MTPDPVGCEEVTELLGAYALDALDPPEAERVEAHLAICPRCSHEVSGFRETIGLIASEGGDAPPQLWGRIAQAIDGGSAPAKAPRLPAMLRPRRAPAWKKTVIGLAAAAAVAAVTLLGVQTARVDHLSSEIGRLNAAAHQTGGFEGATAAMTDPSASHMVLAATAPGARPLGELAILPSGRAYLIGASLPPLPTNQTYQLWAATSGRMISVGVLGRQPVTVAFSVDPAVPTHGYLVTVEPAGGVVAPTASPVAQAYR